MDGIYEKFEFSPELFHLCFTIIGDLVVFEKNRSGVELPKYNLKDIKFSKKNRMKILNTDLIKKRKNNISSQRIFILGNYYLGFII